MPGMAAPSQYQGASIFYTLQERDLHNEYIRYLESTQESNLIGRFQRWYRNPLGENNATNTNT